MNLTTSSIGRPVTTVMVFVCFLAFGAIASRLLPLEYFPEMDQPMLMVNIPYQGSAPEEIERQITRPAEEVLATVSGVKMMRSTSSEDGTFIFMRFDWGEDTGIRALEVREKLDGIRSQFPSDLERIFVRQQSTSDWPILTIRISSDRDLSGSYELLERNVKRRLERLDGISRVDLDGVAAKEVRIELIADRVAAHNVDVAALAGQLRNANFALTAGRIDDAGRRFTVRPMGELATVDQVADIVIDRRGLRLRDVAEVVYGPPELEYGRHLNGVFAVGITVFKEAGANTVSVARSINHELELLKDDPEMEGIQLYYMNNSADGIVSSLTDLLNAGLLGALFAVIVLLFFLRHIATTMIVVLAVPISLTLTLGFLYVFGLSLNILTMMGLMLAVGMLVDNAVVVTESIHRHQLLSPLDRMGATLRGVREVSLAVTAGTLTTSIVFLPMIISPSDEVTTFLKHVSVTICIALAASLVIALTIVPLFTSRLKPKASVPKRTSIDWLIDRYGRALTWLIRHPRSAALFILLILASVMIPARVVNMDFFPDENNTRELRLHYHINGTYTLERVEQDVDRIEGFLFANLEEFEIESVYSFYRSNQAQTTITLKEGKEARKTVAEIEEEIRQGLPKITIGSPSFTWRRSGGGGDGLRVTLAGESSAELADITRDVALMLSRVPGLKDSRSEAEQGDEEVRVVVDRERALQYGFSSQQVASTVATAMRGTNLRHFRTEQGEVAMRVRFQDSDRETIEHLRNLPIRGSGDRTIKLAALADLEMRRGPQAIQREDRKTMLGVTVTPDGISASEARQRIQTVLASYHFPPGYVWSFGQDFRRSEDSQNIMLMNLLMALIMIYLVMAALFESLIYPAAIWTSILFAIVGVFWFFMITGTTFSVMAWIGVLVLVGVVVNNGIVLIDHINYLRSTGMPRSEAIVQGGRDRLRPILMTAMTTVLGLIPLCIGTTQIGGDGPPYYPMARAIVGGLAFSTVVTLVVLPTIYLMLDDLRKWGRRMVRS